MDMSLPNGYLVRLLRVDREPFHTPRERRELLARKLDAAKATGSAWHAAEARALAYAEDTFMASMDPSEYDPRRDPEYRRLSRLAHLAWYVESGGAPPTDAEVAAACRDADREAGW